MGTHQGTDCCIGVKSNQPLVNTRSEAIAHLQLEMRKVLVDVGDEVLVKPPCLLQLHSNSSNRKEHQKRRRITRVSTDQYQGRYALYIAESLNTLEHMSTYTWDEHIPGINIYLVPGMEKQKAGQNGKTRHPPMSHVSSFHVQTYPSNSDTAVAAFLA